MLPDWLGVGSIDELIEHLYPQDERESANYAEVRRRCTLRASALLFSPDMKAVWAALVKKRDAGAKVDIPKFFWVAMNVELLFNPTPELGNPDIQKRYSRIWKLALELRSELRAFSDEVGFSPYSDMQRTIIALSRATPQDCEPEEFDLAYAHMAQEVQYPHHGFDNGGFEKALNVLAETSRIVSQKRQSRNRISKASNRRRNEIALALSMSAKDSLGSYFDEIVATTTNVILDLVEDGEAITGDDVKKLRVAKNETPKGKKNHSP
jgi:hypothetical protein